MNFWFCTSVKMPNLSFLDNPYFAITYQVSHWPPGQGMSLNTVAIHHLALFKADIEKPFVVHSCIYLFPVWVKPGTETVYGPFLLLCSLKLKLDQTNRVLDHHPK